MTQLNLFDMNIKSTKKGVDFKDNTQEILDKMFWESPQWQTFYETEEGNKLTKASVILTCSRKFPKKKDQKMKFFVDRIFCFEGLEERIEDSVTCKDLKELEEYFESEKAAQLWQHRLPKDVIFDGSRYLWKFEVDENKIIHFKEKWIPQEDENENL